MAANAPDVYVALLRGINVGGKNSLPMKELAALFTAAGCKDVKTYIQSGNVVFRASPAVVKTLAKKISAGIEAGFGMKIPVVILSAEEMQRAVKGNPYLKEANPNLIALHVLFLADEAAADAAKKLDAMRSYPDRFHVKGRSIYLHLPNGGARTKLTNAYFDKALATVTTQRNWATTLKLLEMMQA